MHNSPPIICKGIKNGLSAWSQSPICQNAQLTTYDWQRDEEWPWNHHHNHSHQHAKMYNSPAMYDYQSRMKNGHGIISMITVTNMHKMHNSPPIITRAGWRVAMESSEWSQPPTCQNVQLTSYNWQSRMKNGHGIISMITVIKLPKCTTHPLWLAGGWRMAMESSAWSQSPTCQNAQLTSYNWQRRMKNRHGIISMITATNMAECNSQTMYDFQSRMKNGHGIISMITATNMPECTTHKLWLPKDQQQRHIH